jgi:hypothetical protein
MKQESYKKLMKMLDEIYSSVEKFAEFASELEISADDDLIHKWDDSVNKNTPPTPYKALKRISPLIEGLEAAQCVAVSKACFNAAPDDLYIFRLNNFLEKEIKPYQ